MLKKLCIHNTALIKLLRAALAHPVPSLLLENPAFQASKFHQNFIAGMLPKHPLNPLHHQRAPAFSAACYLETFHATQLVVTY